MVFMEQFSPSVRVVHGGNLPVPVNLGLPGPRPTLPHERVAGRIYLEDYLPQGDAHHSALGLFLEAWGQVETLEALLLSKLLDINFSKGSIVFQSIGARRSMSMIVALATSQLTDFAILKLVNLEERFSALNSKRNALVHGMWTLEFKVFGHKGEVRHRAEFARETIPNDYRVKNRLGDLRNQKERSRYIFSVKRIRTATLEAYALCSDAGKFIENDLIARTPVNWQVSEFLSRLYPQTHPAQFGHFFLNPATLLE